jgi:hypothetical protein
MTNDAVPHKYCTKAQDWALLAHQRTRAACTPPRSTADTPSAVGMTTRIFEVASTVPICTNASVSKIGAVDLSSITAWCNAPPGASIACCCCCSCCWYAARGLACAAVVDCPAADRPGSITCQSESYKPPSKSSNQRSNAAFNAGTITCMAGKP